MKKSFLAMCTLLMFATAAPAQERKSENSRPLRM